ncbi:stage II sporulation protein M [Paenibacillus sp. FSL K6-2862]|uniref:stage II sporulation protein M n=1 Tax=Paenibacillus sp. FSL K6-2862 TaxID=2921484 RepID=UPI0030F85201
MLNANLFDGGALLISGANNKLNEDGEFVKNEVNSSLKLLISKLLEKINKEISSTIPHYCVEVLAFCLFAAALFELNRVIRKKVRSVFKKGKDQVPLVKEILGTIKIYGVLILPMIMAAAFLETYIADIIFNLF